MDVEVIFFAQLREVTGIRQQTVPLNDGATVATLVDRLTEQYGAAFREGVEQTEGLRILVSDREYGYPDGMATTLRQGDTIIFLPPIHGG